MLVIREPHIAIAPRLERLVDVALEVAPKDGMLAYPRPSGDWTDPKPPAKIKSHVRAVPKGTTNATMSLSSLDDERSFELEYEAYLPVWLTRGQASVMATIWPAIDHSRKRSPGASTLSPWPSRDPSTTTCGP